MTVTAAAAPRSGSCPTFRWSAPAAMRQGASSNFATFTRRAIEAQRVGTHAGRQERRNNDDETMTMTTMTAPISESGRNDEENKRGASRRGALSGLSNDASAVGRLPPCVGISVGDVDHIGMPGDFFVVGFFLPYV